MPTIKMRTLNGDILEVDSKVMMYSSVIKSMFSTLDFESDEGNKSSVVPINFDTATMRLVVEWAEHYKKMPNDDENITNGAKLKDLQIQNNDMEEKRKREENENEVESEDLHDLYSNVDQKLERQRKLDSLVNNIPAWDEEFLERNKDMLYDLMLAAKYLQIRGLIDSTCKTVAKMIRGESPKTLRKVFGFPNDMDE